jgi:hypothetical protein
MESACHSSRRLSAKGGYRRLIEMKATGKSIEKDQVCRDAFSPKRAPKVKADAISGAGQRGEHGRQLAIYLEIENRVDAE